MGNKWMPIVAGILDVVNGIGVVILGLTFVMISALTFGPDDILSPLIGFVLIITGVLVIASGVFAFRRKRWLLTLIGTVFPLVPSVPVMYNYWRWSFYPDVFFVPFSLLGFSGIPAIVAIILIVRSRNQFNRE